MATEITDRQRQLEQVGQDVQQVWVLRMQALSAPLGVPQGLSAQDLPAYRGLLSDLGTLKMSWELALAEMAHVLDPGLPWHWCEMGNGEAETLPSAETTEPKVLRQAPSLLPSSRPNTNPTPLSQPTTPPDSSLVSESPSVLPTEEKSSLPAEEQRQISFKRLSDFAAFVKEEPQKPEGQSRPALQSSHVPHKLSLPETGTQVPQAFEDFNLPSSLSPSSFSYSPETSQNKSIVEEKAHMQSASQEKGSPEPRFSKGAEASSKALPSPEQSSMVHPSALPPYPAGAIGLPTWEGVQAALESMTASPSLGSQRHKGRSQVAMRTKVGNVAASSFQVSMPLTKNKAKGGLLPAGPQNPSSGFEMSSLEDRHNAPAIPLFPQHGVSQPRSPFLEGLDTAAKLREAESLKGPEISPHGSFSHQEPFMVDQLMDALTDQLKRDFKRLYGA